MTYASLLVAVEDGAESDSRLELACDLASASDALLIGLSVGTIAPPIYDPLAGGAMLGELLALYRDLAEADIERARLRFLEVTKDRSLDVEWRDGIGNPADFCSRAARAADLVILGGRNGPTPNRAPDVPDVLMGCGRPVLVVPASALRPPTGAPALVAWKDCREARRALSGAIPLLRRASSVTIYSICSASENEGADGEIAEVIRYLARHEIPAEPVIALAGQEPTGHQILNEALDREAGLVVAGGYGHSRLREWVLGGVTRSLIADSPICLALAH